MGEKSKYSHDESREGQTESDEFEQLFRSTYPSVYKFARRRVRSHEAAEDVANEAFLIAWRRGPDVPGEPLPWLLGVARKLIATRRRSEKRKPATPLGQDWDAFGSQKDFADQLAERDALFRAFASMDGRDQEVLKLSIWDGFGATDAGRILGIPASVFSVRLLRARRRLIRKLELAEPDGRDSVGSPHRY